MVNMTVSDSYVPHQEGTSGVFFTPEQYASILKLLERETSDNLLASANMAGPMHWEDNGDW